MQIIAPHSIRTRGICPAEHRRCRLTGAVAAICAVASLAACGGPGGNNGSLSATDAAGNTVAVTGQPASRAATLRTANGGTGILGRYSAELEPINQVAARIGALTVRYPDGVGGAVQIDNATYGAGRHNLNTRTRRNQANNVTNRDNMDELVLRGAFKELTANTPGAGEIYGSYSGALNFNEADGSGRGPGALSATEQVDGDELPMVIECEYVVSKVEPNSGGVCRSSSDDDAKNGGLWLLVF